MTVEQFVKVLGESNFQNQQQGLAQFLGMSATLPPMQNPPVGPTPPLAPTPLSSYRKVNKQALLGNYDFLPFDGTLPSARQALAATLQELLQLLLAKPENSLLFQFNPILLLNEILELRGVRNPDRFRLTPDAAQQLMQLAGVARNAVSTKPAQGGGVGPNGNSNQPNA